MQRGVANTQARKGGRNQRNTRFDASGCVSRRLLAIWLCASGQVYLKVSVWVLSHTSRFPKQETLFLGFWCCTHLLRSTVCRRVETNGDQMVALFENRITLEVEKKEYQVLHPFSPKSPRFGEECGKIRGNAGAAKGWGTWVAPCTSVTCRPRPARRPGR